MMSLILNNWVQDYRYSAAKDVADLKNNLTHYVCIFVDGRPDWVQTMCCTEETKGNETGLGSTTQE